MKNRLLIILTLLTIIPSVGQDIEKIVFTSQQADEPPTKQGRSKYTIEFKRQTNGELVSSDFNKNKKRKKLKDKITIDKGQVEKVIKWRALSKKRFTQSDLGLDMGTLKTRRNDYVLNFEIPTDLTVNVDSFQFCQTYKMTKSISTGGETLTVTLINKKGLKEEFIFDSDDIGKGSFKLEDYIFCYTLLLDKIPNEVPHYNFFSKDKLMDIVLYYQATVECEGYYYKEYTDKNPKMTSKDKRMRTGWNFVEYMGQRIKSK
jgi:hypothetical protein